MLRTSMSLLCICYTHIWPSNERRFRQAGGLGLSVCSTRRMRAARYQSGDACMNQRGFRSAAFAFCTCPPTMTRLLATCMPKAELAAPYF